MDFIDFVLRLSSINLESVEVNEKLIPVSPGVEFLSRSQVNRGFGVLKTLLQIVYLPLKLLFLL